MSSSSQTCAALFFEGNTNILKKMFALPATGGVPDHADRNSAEFVFSFFFSIKKMKLK
jgi:hypothetical protein